MKSIVILASGSGTNAENIIKYFQNNGLAKVVLVLTNKKNAKVLDRATSLNISGLYLNKIAFSNNTLLDLLKGVNPDLIVLAGFLRKIDKTLVEAFPNKIINIHPALLPKYGGKGMYGRFVHEAVKENKEVETGITIHYVNEHYDEGNIIFQAKTSLSLEDDIDAIAAKVHELEYEHFPKIIENLLNG